MRAPWVLGLVIGLVIAATGNLRAQSMTGALEGAVLGTQDEPLEGVVVVANVPNLQGQRSTMTETRGRFLLLGLPPGLYSVQFC